MTISNILSIAGSDPSGGAGVQADLKAIAANGGYGMAALTALTAQNTCGVAGVHVVPAGFVSAQIKEVFADVRVDAVKIGMLATAEVIESVLEAFGALGLDDRTARTTKIVLDPVMIATSGDRLLAEDAAALIAERMLPLADVSTPNLDEAAALLGRPPFEGRVGGRAGMPALARAVQALGGGAVYLKGGHLIDATSPDFLLTADGAEHWLEAPRHSGREIHGGGCTLSAALATRLALTGDVATAAAETKQYVAQSIAKADALSVGTGARPLHHFHAMWSDQ